MMSLIIGLTNLAVGLAYAGLGLLSVWETVSLHRYRGWSRFGIGFAMMAASCGPHHLVHGWHALAGEAVTVPMLAVTLIGLPAGLIFVLLRLETVFGGQGERLFAASPDRVALFVGTFTAVAGVLAASAFMQPASESLFQLICAPSTLAARAAALDPAIDFASVMFVTNVFVTVTYGMVGWYLADCQVRRYLTNGIWSLSGVALTGVFFTCAQMHLIDATSGGNAPILVFDLMGIPASVYFLWVVKLVHNDSVMDWNRRPLVGAAAAPPRPSPWRGESPQH